MWQQIMIESLTLWKIFTTMKKEKTITNNNNYDKKCNKIKNKWKYFNSKWDSCRGLGGFAMQLFSFCDIWEKEKFLREIYIKKVKRLQGLIKEKLTYNVCFKREKITSRLLEKTYQKTCRWNDFLVMTFLLF